MEAFSQTRFSLSRWPDFVLSRQNKDKTETKTSKTKPNWHRGSSRNPDKNVFVFAHTSCPLPRIFSRKFSTLGLLYSSAFHGQLCIQPAHCDGSSQQLTWVSSDKPLLTPARRYLGRVNWGGKMPLLWVAALPGWDPGVHTWGREVHSMSSVLCFMIVDVGNYPLELELK